MSVISEEAAKLIRPIIETQLFGILATRDANALHTSLVAFAASADLATLFFATPSQSRKFSNLSRYAPVSLFIDNRINDPARIRDITGIGIKGDAQCVDEGRRAAALKVYTEKHPQMSAFVEEPHTALVQVRAVQYDIVTQFQNVITFTAS